ncbi:hypothetical protein GCM10009624_35170 [Gordonia sinesedis]
MSVTSPAQLASQLRPTVTRLYLALRRRTPMADYAYTAAQASAMATLMDHGPLRIGELADRESIRMPTATTLVDGLTRNGLADRQPDPDDRRAVLVGLTEHGRSVLRTVGARRDDVLTRALATLDDEQRAALAAAAPALWALHRALESDAVTPPLTHDG